MRDRKLSWAINEAGKKVFIEDLKDDELKQKFNCPHCYAPVIPKRGEKKIWHFAHKGEECEFVKNNIKTKDDTTKNSSLNAFMAKTTTMDNMEFEDSDIFTCAICTKEDNKDNGTEWSKKIWICKNCYLHLSDEDMKKLEELEDKF